MKVAVSIAGDSLAAMVDPRFGRAARFMIFDTETGTFTLMDNVKNLNAPQGAGIQTAQNVAAAGVAAVITGHTGPKAFKVLKAAGITIHQAGTVTVQEALAAFRAGSLPVIDSADVEGHWQ